jgi:hypothetical protein
MDKDLETLKTEQEGQLVNDYVKSDGWQYVRDRFTEKIMDLQSIMNVDPDPNNVIVDLKSRKMAVDILMDLIRDIEGRASQHENNSPILTTQSEEIIVQY